MRDNRRVVICNIVFRYTDKEPYARSGKSILGGIEVNSAGEFKCHECGAFRKSIGKHLREHGITAADYRLKHGLKRKTQLSLRRGPQKFKNRGNPQRAIAAMRSPEAQARARVFQQMPRHELRSSSRMAWKVTAAASNEIAESRQYPGHWHVEAVREDGSVEVAIFSGPGAEKRAKDYRNWRTKTPLAPLLLMPNPEETL